MLASVVTADGTLVNTEVARAGFAELLEIGGNDRFAPDVQAAVDETAQAGRGLWAPGACGCRRAYESCSAAFLGQVASSVRYPGSRGSPARRRRRPAA